MHVQGGACSIGPTSYAGWQMASAQHAGLRRMWPYSVSALGGSSAGGRSVAAEAASAGAAAVPADVAAAAVAAAAAAVAAGFGRARCGWGPS